MGGRGGEPSRFRPLPPHTRRRCDPRTISVQAGPGPGHRAQVTGGVAQAAAAAFGHATVTSRRGRHGQRGPFRPSRRRGDLQLRSTSSIRAQALQSPAGPTTMETRISKPRPEAIKGPCAVSLVNADQTLPGQIPGPLLPDSRVRFLGLWGIRLKVPAVGRDFECSGGPGPGRGQRPGSLSLRTSLPFVRSTGPGHCRARSRPREGEAIRVTDIIPRPPIPAAAAGDRWARIIRVAARRTGPSAVRSRRRHSRPRPSESI